MAIATAARAEAVEARTTELQRRRVGISAFLGTTIEYYDFTLYGLMGPVVFGKLFFPGSDPSVQLLLILAIYGVGFFGRPIGGLVFSHFGDRFGRKPVMVTSMTVMGLASTAMGLLPSYAQLGVWAPVILVFLRVIQGFALGGESAGANVLSTEVGPQGARGFFTSLTTSGIFVAWILAVGASTLVSYLPKDELLAWGWRLPFLASIALVAVGIWMRMRVEESAVFKNAIRKKAPAKVPFFELMRVAPKPTIIVIVSSMAESASGFFFLVFAFGYAVATLKISSVVMFHAMLIGTVIGLFACPACGALSDRIGRRTTLTASYLLAAVFTSTLFFPMLQSGNSLLISLAMIFPIAICNPLSLGVVASYYSEQFADARLRYSGVGFGRGLGTTLGGGLMPIIAASLMQVTGGSRIGPIVWFDIVCIAAVIAIHIARETKDERLE